MEQKKKMPIWVKIVLAVGAIVIGVNLLRAAALMPAFYRYMSKNNPVIIQNYHKCRHFADMFRSYQMGQDRKKEVYGYEIDDLYLYNGSFSDFLREHKDFYDEVANDYYYKQDRQFDPDAINTDFIYKVKNAHFELIITETEVEVYIPELVDSDGNVVTSGKIELYKPVEKKVE